jgi:hypothetical protein
MVTAKVREKLSISKQITQHLNKETFDFKKIDDFGV